MEKNERLAWRTEPRTYCRCFSSCPKRHCKGRPFQLQIRKKQLFRPRKVVFYFPFQTLLGAGTTLFRCFSSCPKRHCKGRPFQLQIRKKTTFQAPKSCFFIYPSKHSWEQALRFSGAFPAAQSAIAKGDPSNCKLEKTTFQAPKSCFLFFLPNTLGSRRYAFQVLFQLPKAPLQRHSWEQALSFSGAFPAAQSAIAKGDPSNCKLEKQQVCAKEFEKFAVMLATSEQITSESRQSRNMRVSCPVVQADSLLQNPASWFPQYWTRCHHQSEARLKREAGLCSGRGG